MKSTIILYQGVPITPSKNFAVELISTYLSGLPASRKQTFTNQNYVRQNLYVGARLLFEQESLDLNASNWNYCSVTNIDENGVAQKTCYYFIKKISQSSKEVALLDLEMDTLNTIGASIKLTPRTLIHRENKNRWEVSGVSAIGKIDKTLEDFTPMLYKTDEIKLDNEDYNSFKWYLVYMTDADISETDYNQVTAIKTLIAPEHDIEIFTDSGTLTLPLGSEYYTLSPKWNETNKAGLVAGKHISIEEISETNISSIDLSTYPTTKYIYNFVRIRHNSSTYEVTDFTNLYSEDMTLLKSYEGTTQSLGAVTYTGMCGTLKMTRTLSSNPVPLSNPDFYYRPNATTQITGVSTMDKTNQRLIKIVELPYCPIKIYEVYNKTTYSFEMPVKTYSYAGWSSEFIYILGVNLDYYKNDITISKQTFTDLTGLKKLLNFDFYRNQLRDKSFEPKMLSSEIHGKKFVYDSFTFDFKMELLNINDTYSKVNSHFSFKQVSSLAVTSKFLFDFTDSVKYSESIEDYTGVLPVTRNNEVTIYNNQYINYLRTGLQYDLKQKALQEETNITKQPQAQLWA